MGKIAEAEGGLYVDLRPEARPEVAGLRLEPARRVEGLLEIPSRTRRPARA